MKIHGREIAERLDCAGARGGGRRSPCKDRPGAVSASMAFSPARVACRLVLLTVFGTLAGGPLSAGAGATAGGVGETDRAVTSGDRLPFYIRFEKGRRTTVEQAVRALGGRVNYRFPRLRTIAVTVPDGAAGRIRALDHVVFHEPVPEHRPLAEAVPWNIDQVQARDVWDADRDGARDKGVPAGAGIRVCIIDTGFFAEHDDLQGIAAEGVSQIPDEDWFEDGDGHGTHVAGTANAVNNDMGVVGVTPGAAELFVVKIFDNDGDWRPGRSNLAAAASTCRDAGAHVINMSLGGDSSATEEAVFQDLYDNFGILSVAAAGNDGDEACNFPACYEAVISVAALDRDEAVAGFSQAPSTIYDPEAPPANAKFDANELAAGGVAVLSTVPAPDGSVPVFRVSVSGTDFDGSHIDESGLGTVSGALQDGGLCQPGDTRPAWAGAIVICSRGEITFAEKHNNVRDGGGLAAVIYNNVSGTFLGTCAGDCSGPLIPAISLGQEAGQSLVADKLGLIAEVVADDGSGCAGCTGGYTELNGTSMATPGVAAGAALVWSACGGPAGIDNKQLRLLLRDSARDLAGVHPATGAHGAGWDAATGWGLVQARAAIDLGGERFGHRCHVGFSVVPARQTLCTASVDRTEFTITLGAAFTGTTDLEVSGNPDGSVADFSANPVVYPANASVLSVANIGAQTGRHDLKVTAVDRSDPETRLTNAAHLELFADPPAPVMLSTPEDGAGGISRNPLLSWNPEPGAAGYRLEIATDSGFTDPVYSAETVAAQHPVADTLDADRQYFWRVIALNPCGQGEPSATRSFATGLLYCSGPGLAIPDNSPAGVSDSIVIPDAGKIQDLDVSLRIAHTWIGDLVVTLTNEATATAVTLIDRPGKSGGGFGCDGDNMDVTLDDEAASPVEDQCAEGTASEGILSPNEPLSGFDGEEISATWTLNVADRQPAFSGTLEDWCLAPRLADENAAPAAHDDRYASGEGQVLAVAAPGVLANDTDADGDGLAAVPGGDTASGTLELAADGSFTYVPDPGFAGQDVFTYRASDGESESSEATVTIVVGNGIFTSGFEVTGPASGSAQHAGD